MEAVCGENTVYESTDTESFGEAMNKAFASAYPTNIVTIPVSADFTNVRGLEVSTSAGEASYDSTRQERAVQSPAYELVALAAGRAFERRSGLAVQDIAGLSGKNPLVNIPGAHG